jgi:subtilase family serine protease
VTSVSSPQNLPIVTPPPLLPDLVINSLDYSLGPYVIPYTDSMDICVEVKNIGYSMSGESTAKIVVNDEVKFLSFPSIQPNKIVSGCVSFSKVKSFDGECSYNESLWLDYDNKVNEVNEKNNNGTDQWGNYVGYGEEWYCLQN